jgi:putative transposon-encoded protein
MKNMRRITVNKGKIVLRDEVVGFIEKRATRFGTGAKVDCPKEYVGNPVYLVICEKRDKKSGKTAKKQR